jgi:hypothetical protein
VRLTLHFMELEPNDAGPRALDVHVQGKAAIQGLDVSISAGGHLRGITRVVNTRTTDGALTLKFMLRSERPAIQSGLEVLPD